MMRVAIAGTNTLARLIARFVRAETSHQLVVLSRTAHPELTAQGYQVLIVNYNDPVSVRHALMGVDTVISTVTGPPQFQLIEAAVHNGVRRFAPAEFEGLPTLRPSQDPLDRGRLNTLGWLQHYSSSIQSTLFVCGILYERFAPGGLARGGFGNQLPPNSGITEEGAYIMNVRTMVAQAPVYNAAGEPNVTICMTAAQDVGRFVVRALDMPQWPQVMTMSGERMTVSHLVSLVEQTRGVQLTSYQRYDPAALQSELTLAQSWGDRARELRAHQHIATAMGRYDFRQPYLNQRFPDIQPLSFRNWLSSVWAVGG